MLMKPNPPPHIDMILDGQIRSVSEVQAFADARGGEEAVRQAQRDGIFGQPGFMADEVVDRWLREADRRRQDALVMGQLQVAARAAAAAEQSARWALFSAVISLTSTIVAVAAYLLALA
jgi:hypothetical protein